MMAVKIRISSITIRPYYGEGDEVPEIRKIKVVATLQGINDVEGLMALCLEGSMLALYFEKDKENQLRAMKIKQCLKKAYMEGMYTVFAKLGIAGWTREQGDAYATEVWRKIYLVTQMIPVIE